MNIVRAIILILVLCAPCEAVTITVTQGYSRFRVNADTVEDMVAFIKEFADLIEPGWRNIDSPSHKSITTYIQQTERHKLLQQHFPLFDHIDKGALKNILGRSTEIADAVKVYEFTPKD